MGEKDKKQGKISGARTLSGGVAEESAPCGALGRFLLVFHFIGHLDV